MILGNLDSHVQRNETGQFSYTIHKNKFKMNKRPKCETENQQNPRGEHRQQSLLSWPQQLLARHIAGSKGNKSKNELSLLYQDKKLLWREGNNQQKQKATFKMADICKWHI